MKTALVSYIYPKAILYLESLLFSIRTQTSNEFDVIFFLDGAEFSSSIANKLSTYDLTGSGNPLQIRLKSFEILRNLPYENYIFIDADDTMTDNRVQVLTTSLDSQVLVCNDLNLMDVSGDIFAEKVWETRLGRLYTFDSHFLREKNIVGFGNVAVKKSLLNTHLSYNDLPKVADWFIFYQLITKNNLSCLFSSECQTNYRQHAQNDAGLQYTQDVDINYNRSVKEAHYDALSAIGLAVNDASLESENSNNMLNRDQYPFWWE